MLRHLTFMLLMGAILFLAVFPHASLAEGAPQMPGACLHHQAGLAEHHDSKGPCGQAGHRMSGACAIACIGSMAPAPQPAGILPAEFAMISLWFPSALVLRGRSTGPDDRPPRFI